MSSLHEALYLLNVVDHRFKAKIFPDYAMIIFILKIAINSVAVVAIYFY